MAGIVAELSAIITVAPLDKILLNSEVSGTDVANLDIATLFLH